MNFVAHSIALGKASDVKPKNGSMNHRAKKTIIPIIIFFILDSPYTIPFYHKKPFLFFNYSAL
jgi:hypothetical protein